jgi:hypothetical protein
VLEAGLDIHAASRGAVYEGKPRAAAGGAEGPCFVRLVPKARPALPVGLKPRIKKIFHPAQKVFHPAQKLFHPS